MNSIVKVLALVCLVLVSQAAATRCRKRRQLNYPELRDLMSSGIRNTQRVRRPLGDGNLMWGPLSHSGVIAETDRPIDGTNRWLVHKGKGFGNFGQTIVTRADGMSRRWENVGDRRSGGGSTMSDLIRRGGRNYNLFNDNCHHAARRIQGRRGFLFGG